MDGKIYSPLGKFAEQAKLTSTYLVHIGQTDRKDHVVDGRCIAVVMSVDSATVDIEFPSRHSLRICLVPPRLIPP